MVDYIFFSSIGFVQEKHPIFQIAGEFPIITYICLFASEEPHGTKFPIEMSTENNIKRIREYFSISSNREIEIEEEWLNQENIQQNSFFMANKIIQILKKRPQCEVLLDLSAGRNAIRLALSRAGEIVNDYLTGIGSPKLITCAIRPENYPEVISYPIKNFPIPNEKDKEMLNYFLYKHDVMTQNELLIELGWKNQGEISKSLQRLFENGYLDHDKQELTEDGRIVAKFLENVVR
ncbi:MAG: hypothetical protein INQ03_21425 [Candidatus Heimdallarchaeota archaeon]|nr:hypothetical protein [Candidatus Heimdallarchaeota archaeon]